MKKVFFISTIVFCFLGFVAIGISQTSGPNPDDQLSQIQALHQQYSADVHFVIGDYQLDYHPSYGYVGIDDMAVHPGGWQEAYLPELFPGDTILSYQLKTVYISGRVLMRHKDALDNEFFVWHEVQDEPVNYYLCKTANRPIDIWRLVRSSCGNDMVVLVDGLQVAYISGGQWLGPCT